MPEFRFAANWIDGEGEMGPELSSTMAALKIQVGNSILTRVFDDRSKTIRNIIYVPAYPLAEWLAMHWWFLTAETENPENKNDPQFQKRHALETVMDGYAYPCLKMVSSGDSTRLKWSSHQSRWAGLTFTENGEAWIDNDKFRKICTDWIDRVIRRLDSRDIHGTLLQEEWVAIRAADDAESNFCRVAASLGRDPYALDDAGRAHVISIARACSVRTFAR